MNSSRTICKVQRLKLTETYAGAAHTPFVVSSFRVQIAVQSPRVTSLPREKTEYWLRTILSRWIHAHAHKRIHVTTIIILSITLTCDEEAVGDRRGYQFTGFTQILHYGHRLLHSLSHRCCSPFLSSPSHGITLILFSNIIKFIIGE